MLGAFRASGSSICCHLNRVIRKYDLDMLYVAGQATADLALVANVYLEGTQQYYPNVSGDRTGCAGCSNSSRSPAAFQ